MPVSLSLWLAAAQALQLPVDPVELCQASERVVVAEVTDLDARYTADGRIERLVHASVERTVKGPTAHGVDFVLPGGTIGDQTLYLSDTPNLLSNGRYLLFLGADKGRLIVFGGEQGAVRITREGARRGVSLDDALAMVEGCNAP